MKLDTFEIRIGLIPCVANNRTIGDNVFSFPCIGDISYIFRYPMESEESGTIKSILLTKDLVKELYPGLNDTEIKSKILMNQALNLNPSEDIVITTLEEMLTGERVKHPNLLVVTNKSMIYGAYISFLFAPYVSWYLKTHYGICNYYILPSSVHETMIVPDDKGLGTRDLKDMVIEVNGMPNYVNERSKLSDMVFYYTPKIGKVIIA